MLLKQAAVF